MRAERSRFRPIEQHEHMWVTRRIDIARHWKDTHPFNPETAFVWQSK